MYSISKTEYAGKYHNLEIECQFTSFFSGNFVRYNWTFLITSFESITFYRSTSPVEKSLEPFSKCPNTYILMTLLHIWKYATYVQACNKLSWPSRKSTILDESQYDAVQSAFLRELCLIQGPPGTGKTYVGLLIVKMMLLNDVTNKPILVVCYTNHALDQFLEGNNNLLHSSCERKKVNRCRTRFGLVCGCWSAFIKSNDNFIIRR